MKKQFLLLNLVMCMATTSYAQWSAGALLGLGHLSQRQVSQSPDYLSVLGVEPIQPLIIAGGYGQFVNNGKWPVLAGIQLRYQHYRQTDGTYDYLVVTPYLGARLFKNLEVAAGPELSTLLHAGLPYSGYSQDPTKIIIGYNIKATYWLGRLGIEGGYSYQNTAFNRAEHPSTTTFDFYNRYVYGVVKYRLTR